MKDDIAVYLENYKKQWRKNYFSKRKYNDNIYVLVPTILGFGKILIYLVLIYLILQGKYDVATLVLVVGYYENVESKFRKSYDCLDSISANSTRVDRAYNVLNYKTKNMLKFGSNETDDILGEVEFKNVSLLMKNKR